MVARTDASESAPAYALESSAVLPPSDTEAAPPHFSLFPTSFTIAGMQVSALVQTSDLKLHLCLLGAFHDLRKRVESGSEGITSELEPAARWSVFISIAVYRFEQYLASCVQDSGNTLEMPPLDVALVWHSYALNPRSVLRCQSITGGELRSLFLDAGGTLRTRSVFTPGSSVRRDFPSSPSYVTLPLAECGGGGGLGS